MSLAISFGLPHVTPRPPRRRRPVKTLTAAERERRAELIRLAAIAEFGPTELAKFLGMTRQQIGRIQGR